MWHMHARVFQFQVGRSKLGGLGKVILAVVAVLVTAFLVMFGIFAAVLGLATKAFLQLSRALGAGQRPRAASSPKRMRSDLPEQPAREAGHGIVRDVEVEVLKIEDRA
jgi:hypothetical protein